MEVVSFSEKQEIKVECEVYSRVVGFMRPVQNWHDGKKQEFNDRKVFDPGKALSHPTYT